MKPREPISPDTLRVLLVSPLPPPSGGIVRWTVLLLEWMQMQPGVLMRTVDISPRWRALEDLKLWKRVVGGMLQGMRDALRTSLQIAIFRPRLLHLNTSAQLRGPWDTVILAVAAMVRVRSVYHIRMGRLPEVMARDGWEWWGLRGALKLADRVVVLDKESEEAMKRFLPAERVLRLPNAVTAPLPGVEYSPSDSRTVLYVGHVIPTKGMTELMEAWREVQPLGWRLRLAGPGSATYQKDLLKIVGPNAGVEFLGDLSPEAAWKCMQAAEIFVLPSYTEGFPNVILEAMAAGKAIISTRVGAVPEILDVDSGEFCGLVIKPRDATVLAAALRQLLSDPQLRETLGRRAHTRVKRSYTTDVVFGRLVSLWNEVAGLKARTEEKSFSKTAE